MTHLDSCVRAEVEVMLSWVSNTSVYSSSSRNISTLPNLHIQACKIRYQFYLYRYIYTYDKHAY